MTDKEVKLIGCGVAALDLIADIKLDLGTRTSMASSAFDY
jgi:hypothetical protein